MEKRQYVLHLKSYCEEHHISFYDYYYRVAIKKKGNPNCSLESFEIENPFLTSADYDKLLSSTDDRICEYFALAMEKVILLNLDIMSKENSDIEEPIILDEDDIDLSKVDDELLTRGDIEDAITDEMGRVEKDLSRKEIEEIIVDEMDEIDKDLSHEDIKSIITDEMDGIEKGLSREDIELVIRDEMNGIDNGLSRNEIASVIGEEFDGLENDLSREDIIDVINDQILDVNGQTLSREEIVSAINDEFNLVSKISDFFVKVGKEISNLLSGFAVFRNEGEKNSDVYLYNAKTKELSGRKTVSFEKLDATTGIYVNYQEYLDRLFDSVLDRYPDADSYSFADEEGNEKTFPELTEEAYQLLIQFGSVRFGDEFSNSRPKSYRELVGMNVAGTSTYCGEELRKGVFVRKDILNEIFSKYQVRATYYSKEDKAMEYVK